MCKELTKEENEIKAVILKEAGGPECVQYTEMDQPVPGAGEVVIKVKNASLNRRDLFITYGMYPGMKLPAVLGADGAGIVYKLGDNVESLSEGDEVVINPGIQWGTDLRFSSPAFCILGMPENGTFAEYVKVPAENVYRKPAYLTWEEAAALPLAALTAYRALFTRGKLAKGETVFIPGIGGGVALFALQMAVAEGAEVFVSSSSDDKIKLAKEVGAKDGVNYREAGWTKALNEKMGRASLIIDGIGGETFKDLVYLAAPGGRIVNFGATAGHVPDLILPRVFFKQIDIRGTMMGSPQEFAAMLTFFEQNNIRPVIDKQILLQDALSALQYMEQGGSFGKIVLTI